ncbi:CAF17-like 4Fe-4S cluster assembly/insertion protein YgfZ [Luteimonas sp. A482]
MSDKPNNNAGTFFAIPGWSVVSLQGVDARRFAQAQFMGDVDALADGHWQWNGWLTPKGRVIALFALLRQDADNLHLLLADSDPAAFVAALSRFVFRSKLRIAHEADLQVSGRFEAPNLARDASFAGTTDPLALQLDLGGAGGARTLAVGTAQAPEDTAAAARWRALDLAHGLPRLEPDQVEQWTPQQLSLDRLRAYSVKKGCYPGQEIVARTHFLGQAKRGLVRLGAAAGIPAGDVFTVDAPDRAAGRIASSAGAEALAVLPVDAGDGAYLVGGMECRRLPLLDGLAR